MVPGLAVVFEGGTQSLPPLDIIASVIDQTCAKISKSLDEVQGGSVGHRAADLCEGEGVRVYRRGWLARRSDDEGKSGALQFVTQ